MPDVSPPSPPHRGNAAVRSQLYEACHPLATEHLVIERTSLGADAGLVGAGQLALHRALTQALADS